MKKTTGAGVGWAMYCDEYAPAARVESLRTQFRVEVGGRLAHLNTGFSVGEQSQATVKLEDKVWLIFPRRALTRDQGKALLFF